MNNTADMKITNIYSPERRIQLSVPLFSVNIAAGFPSPGDDYIDKGMDLNDLILHPAATFLMRVEGDSMSSAGIGNGDLLIVDRAVKAGDNSIVVAALNGELIVRRLKIHNGRHYLVAENPQYRPVEIHPEANFEIRGVVTYSISKHS